MWLWFNGSTPDVVFDHARSAWLAVRDVMEVATEQPAWVFRDSRDLTGFIDGTENPQPLDAPTVALIPNGLPGGGGSHVLVMRWVHDLEAFHAMPVDEQERLIGRKKSDSAPLSRAERHPTGHLSRVQIDVDGVPQKIYRRSVPYGTVAENGLYFIAFSAERKRFDMMLANVFGTAQDGHHDLLTDYSKPVSGAFYFAPSLTTWRSCTIR